MGERVNTEKKETKEQPLFHQFLRQKWSESKIWILGFECGEGANFRLKFKEKTNYFQTK